MGEDFDHTFKFVLVGDSNVGKTSLCKMFCEHTFEENTVQTVGLEFGSKAIDLSGAKIKIQLWDTAGQERFHSITRAYFRSSSAVFMVFDVTARESFQHLSVWADDAIHLSPPQSVKVLIGNKTDLTSQRAVSTEEAEEWAKQQEFAYYETSALSGDRVDDTFMKTAQKVFEMIQDGKMSSVPPPSPPTPAKETENSGCSC